ncbi:hypothetical protein FDP41_010144 [Naegleria fowleri]|uniref:Guanine nucleotide-binding protein subunit beta-like protein n=1 Tax=Naegleria fowleri TaxID=5763 RepID=A0A6A5BC13_NAEFO|nr:uncharacterized protein FDP41_010144 [Naegleria fowleri]KAF0971538.1 hypothetical protein FDP41_010144 [Naegleria fowleri]
MTTSQRILQILLKASTIGKWRPNGNLFGQSTEHKGSVNEISVHDSLYWFVTGGNDGTVRLWDLTNTERDFAMNSKMTYTIIQGGGRVNSVAILNVTSPLIAACTDKGWIHVFSADLGTTMYTITISDSGAIFVQSSSGSKTQEASINVVRPLNIGNQPLLICGNQNGMVVGIDPRAAREAFSWKSKEALEQGPISEICCGDNEPWVISSTKRGFLTLWDLRYQISVSNTRINESAINRISICKNSVLTSSFSSPSVYIASQNNDINLWSLETQQTLYKFRYYEERKQFSTEEPTFDINALYVNDYDGCFYSGSSDGIVRFWDVNKIDQSYVVSGASQQAFMYGAKKEDNCTVFTEDVMSLQRTDQSLTSSTTSNRGKGGTFSQPIATHHLDTITDIEVVSGVSKGHFQPLLLTASRDGMLKVWK